MQIALVAASLVAVALLILSLLTFARLRNMRSRFSGILDAEAEAKRIIVQANTALVRAGEEARQVIDSARKAEVKSAAEVRKSEEALRAVAERYNTARNTYDKMRAEVALLEESLETISYGLYRPHYDFDTSARYKAELDRVYEKKKEMIKAGLAASTRLLVGWRQST